MYPRQYNKQQQENLLNILYGKVSKKERGQLIITIDELYVAANRNKKNKDR